LESVPSLELELAFDGEFPKESTHHSATRNLIIMASSIDEGGVPEQLACTESQLPPLAKAQQYTDTYVTAQTQLSVITDEQDEYTDESPSIPPIPLSQNDGKTPEASQYHPDVPPTLPRYATFIDLPRELRDQVYHYRLVQDLSPEFTSTEDPKSRFERGLMTVKKQIRAEALTTLKEANIWILLIVRSSARDEDRTRIRRLTCRGQMFLPPRAALANNFPANATLLVDVGPGSGGSAPEKSAGPANAFMFAYCPDAFAQFCYDLWLNAELIQYMTISFPRPQHKLSHVRAVEDMMIPLTSIRGFKGVIWKDSPGSPAHPTAEKLLVSVQRDLGSFTSILSLYQDAIKNCYQAKQ
jgi:hypothetical protein